MPKLSQALNLISKKSKEEERLRSPAVNYFGPEEGPFMCGHCEYFKDGFCRNEQVQAHVDFAGCCNLYESIEEDEGEEEEEEHGSGSGDTE